MSVQDPYAAIEDLHKADSLDYFVTLRKSELKRLDAPEVLTKVSRYISLRRLIMRDLPKVKTRRELLKIFYALRLDYFIKDPSKVSSSDLYDTILKDEELYQRP